MPLGLREAISRTLPLQDPSCLHDATRGVIMACRWYRRFVEVLPTLPSGSEVRDELTAVHQAAQELADRLSRLRPEARGSILSVYERVARALPPGTDVTESDNMLWLKHGRRFVGTLSMIAGAAAGRTKRSPTRSDREALDDFVRALAQLAQNRHSGSTESKG
jgi:hypothetical protein